MKIENIKKVSELIENIKHNEFWINELIRFKGHGNLLVRGEDISTLGSELRLDWGLTDKVLELIINSFEEENEGFKKYLSNL